MAKLRIFLADDHAVVRAGLKVLIDSQPDMEVIGEAGDGREALLHAGDCNLDIAVMDFSMPGLNGAEATRQLTASCPNLRVLVLSVHEDAGYLRQVLEAGAAGYVLKRSAPETLIGALRTVASGGIYLDPALGTALVSGFVGIGHPGSASAELSEREADVLLRIARGYSNKEIAAQLHLSIKTVETYKARAMQKLGFNSRVDIVRYAAEKGWLLQK